MTRKQVTFDLSQEMLKKFYPRGNSKSETFYKKAYSDIQKFMLRNGFSHRQYSVYVSDESFSYDDMNELCNELAEQLLWIGDCLNEIDITSVEEHYSMKSTIIEACTRAQSDISADKVRQSSINISLFSGAEEEWEDELKP